MRAVDGVRGFGIVVFFRRFVPRAPSDGTLLAAAVHLEGVALGDVHGSAAPYLGLLTPAASKQRQGIAEHVHTLLVEDDAGVALADIEGIALIEDVIAGLLAREGVEDGTAVVERVLDVDDHVAVDVAARVAAAVEVAADESARLVPRRGIALLHRIRMSPVYDFRHVVASCV